MARAVIKFESNISALLPVLAQAIPGCYYNSQSHLAALNLDGRTIVISPFEILMYNTDNAAAANQILQWFNQIISQHALNT